MPPLPVAAGGTRVEQGCTPCLGCGHLLRGDLAIVGPPPLPPQLLPPSESELFGRALPGLTSWSALAWTGYSPIDVAYKRDLKHFNPWTMRGEARVLAHTVRAVVTRPHGAVDANAD